MEEKLGLKVNKNGYEICCLSHPSSQPASLNHFLLSLVTLNSEFLITRDGTKIILNAFQLAVINFN